MELGSKINFDAQGRILGADTPGPFAFSAVKIEKVHESSTELRIKSKRLVLVYQTESSSPTLKDIRFILLHEDVEIMIAVDPLHPEGLDAAIERVFAFNFQQFFAGKSPETEASELDTLGSTGPNDVKPAPASVGSAPPGAVRKVGNGVSAPRLVYAVDPEFPDKFRRKKIGGICVLSLVIDTSGLPTHIRVVRTPDPAFSLNAIVAVSQYKFKPALLNGKPVPVVVDVE
ncbi:MAG TPA: energy transducer TonB, partial [Acidobacteriaceae bacterium]|nr:energy transducer TonB [Acidobacteriaceae bacterium]